MSDFWQWIIIAGLWGWMVGFMMGQISENILWRCQKGQLDE